MGYNFLTEEELAGCEERFFSEQALIQAYERIENAPLNQIIQRKNVTSEQNDQPDEINILNQINESAA